MRPGRTAPPLRLLREVRGLELAELPAAETCCGFGGTFSVRRLRAAQRAASASRKLIGRSGTIRRLPPPLSAWTDTRDVPAAPPESFRAWWARTRGPGTGNTPGAGGPATGSEPGSGTGPDGRP